MHYEAYANQIEKNLRFRDLYERDFTRRLQFSRDNGCNTVILTGDGEPIANCDFLRDFSHWNKMISWPFRWIEIQTSGVMLDDEMLRFLRNTVEVATISVSMSNVFDSAINAEINGTPEAIRVDIDRLCAEIKRYDFNLRLSLNMNAVYNELPVEELFTRAAILGADQLTFRKLYTSGDPDLHQNRWIREHDYLRFEELRDYIVANGRKLEVLPFGAARYSIHHMSVVVDHDCMSTEVKDALKYLILRSNCKLYTKWDDRGSLLF